MNEKELIQKIVWNNNDKKVKLRLRGTMRDYDWADYNGKILEGGDK